MNLNSEIEKYYANWLKYSRKLAGNRTDGDDLLHTVIDQLLTNPERDNLAEAGRLNFYVIASLRTSFHSSSSRYHYQYRNQKFNEITTEIADAEDSTWIGARLDNEVIDDVVRRFNELDRVIFDLYCQPDFSYEEVSINCGIPEGYLRKRVCIIVKKLRTYVHRSGESSSRQVIHLPRV